MRLAGRPRLRTQWPTEYRVTDSSRISKYLFIPLTIVFTLSMCLVVMSPDAWAQDFMLMITIHYLLMNLGQCGLDKQRYRKFVSYLDFVARKLGIGFFVYVDIKVHDCSIMILSVNMTVVSCMKF